VSFATTRSAVALTTAGVALFAAGCGHSHLQSHASAPSQLAIAWHQVILCARAHGMPGLQDPRIDEQTRNAVFPSGINVPTRTRQACGRLFDRLVPNADTHAPTPAAIRALLRFARCMRQHGISDWPDPRADGTFVPDARIVNSLKSAFRPQLMICERFNPDPNGRVYFNRT
jgi:hypothetical protein